MGCNRQASRFVAGSTALRVFVADGAAEGAKVCTDEAAAYGSMWKMDGCTEPSARGGTLWLPSCSVVCTKGTLLIGLFRLQPALHAPVEPERGVAARRAPSCSQCQGFSLCSRTYF